MTVLLARLARRGRRAPRPASLEARIAAAGAPLGLEPADVMALKVRRARSSALLLVPPLATALPGRLWIAAVLGAAGRWASSRPTSCSRAARARAPRA